MKAKLIINGAETQLGFDELELISELLNDTTKNAGVFLVLARSESVNVRVSVASKRTINLDIFNCLINDSSVEVLRTLASNPYADQFLGKNSIEKLLKTNDTQIYLSIADKIDELSHIVNIDWLCEMIIQNDPSVRYALAGNAHTPPFILTELSVDRDISIAEKAKETLNDNDFDEMG